jgi:hypothetical protein
MAKPSLELVAALRETADRLERGVKFQWSHMGSCNCGHLAQTLTKLKPREIHSAALESVGDWTQQTRDFCPDSGLPLDSVIDAILHAGFTTVDLADLERLRAHEVLAAIPEDRLPLDHRVREDAILYMRTWADLLEQKWKRGMELNSKPVDRELDPA